MKNNPQHSNRVDLSPGKGVSLQLSSNKLQNSVSEG